MLKASRDLVWSPVKAFVCVVGIVIVCVNVLVSCVSHSVREHAVAVGTQLLCVVSQTWWRAWPWCSRDRSSSIIVRVASCRS